MEIMEEFPEPVCLCGNSRTFMMLLSDKYNGSKAPVAQDLGVWSMC